MSGICLTLPLPPLPLPPAATAAAVQTFRELASAGWVDFAEPCVAECHGPIEARSRSYPLHSNSYPLRAPQAPLPSSAQRAAPLSVTVYPLHLLQACDACLDRHGVSAAADYSRNVRSSTLSLKHGAPGTATPRCTPRRTRRCGRLAVLRICSC